MKKLLSLLGLFRYKKEEVIPNGNNTIQGDVIQGLEPLVTVDPEAIEIFINSDKDKFAELYYKKQITPLESRKGCKLNGVIFIPNVYTVSYSENPARIFYGAEKGT